MSAPTTFRTGKIFSALGVRSPIEPRFALTPMQPVAVLSDLSRSFAPSRVEARAVWAVAQASVGATYIRFAFHSLGAGGAIIESFEYGDSALTAGSWLITETIGWVPTVSFLPLSCGGETFNSTLEIDAASASPFIGVGLPANILVPLSVSAEIYVPAGHYFTWVAHTPAPAAAHTSTLGMIVREVPEILGAE